MHYLGLTNVMNCNVYAWPGMYGCKPVIAILKTYLGGCFGLKMASEAITVVQVTSDSNIYISGMATLNFLDMVVSSCVCKSK